MSEEKKNITSAPEIANDQVAEEKKSPVKPVVSDELMNFDDDDDDSMDEAAESKKLMTESEELPDEIKQKLEKNKQARAKSKKLLKKKKKVAKTVKSGRAYINATYNNTLLSLTDAQGAVISWASAGMAGFKGAKKATPYAAQIITKIAVQKAREEYGLEEVKVFVAGVGTGREAAIRALNANGLNITAIKDITPIPHNGCRPKKPRRV